MRIAAYCRVSTDKDEQRSSLSHQQEFFIAYAQKHGHQLIRVYADEGITGTSLKKREAFRQLLLDAQHGFFDMVVVKDVSRFARNTVDALQSIRRLKALGIPTLFLGTNMDSMGDSEFVLTLFSAMAQEESGNLSKRVKWGKKINAEKGRVPQQVFGYNRIDNFTLEINPEEARIVRKIFSLYTLEGMGCRSISQTLNRDGDKTKFQNDWNPRGVRRLLTNPLYRGILVNHKYEIDNFLTGHQAALPEEARFYHQRPQWAIVSPEVFQAAQEIMAARRKTNDSGHPPGRYSGRHLFSTLIKCRHCGRSFTQKSYTYRNTRVYWRCVTNDQWTAQVCDNRTCLEDGALRTQLARYFAAQIRDYDAFVRQTLTLIRQRLAARGDAFQQQEEPEICRKRLLKKMERYKELYASDLLSIQELKEKLSPIQAELAAMDHRLSASETPPLPDDARQIDAIRRFLDLETMTNGDLRRLLDRIEVDRDGCVKIILFNLGQISQESGFLESGRKNDV